MPGGSPTGRGRARGGGAGGGGGGGGRRGGPPPPPGGVGRTSRSVGRVAVGPGKRDPEGGAAALPVLDPGAAAVELGEARDEGEPDARAPRLGVALPERLEHPLLHVVGDPGTVVIYVDERA